MGGSQTQITPSLEGEPLVGLLPQPRAGPLLAGSFAQWGKHTAGEKHMALLCKVARRPHHGHTHMWVQSQPRPSSVSWSLQRCHQRALSPRTPPRPGVQVGTQHQPHWESRWGKSWRDWAVPKQHLAKKTPQHWQTEVSCLPPACNLHASAMGMEGSQKPSMLQSMARGDPPPCQPSRTCMKIMSATLPSQDVPLSSPHQQAES